MKSCLGGVVDGASGEGDEAEAGRDDQVGFGRFGRVRGREEVGHEVGGEVDVGRLCQVEKEISKKEEEADIEKRTRTHPVRQVLQLPILNRLVPGLFHKLRKVLGPLYA